MPRRRALQWIAGCGLLLPATGLVVASRRRRLALVTDERFAVHRLAPGHPESPQRFRAAQDAIDRRFGPHEALRLPIAESVEAALLRVHSRRHVRALKQHFPRFHRAGVLAAGAAVAAVDAVCCDVARRAFCPSRPPGHHARNTGREEGFCFYNNVAIAAAHARVAYGVRRALIVDWDYHHGNGTEWAFYEDPSVLFFSTHDRFAYPGTGDPQRRGRGPGLGTNINVHLGCGAGDGAMIEAFTRQLLPAADDFRPELVLVSAGFDSRREDPLGCFEVSDDGFRRLTELVIGIAERHAQGRLVSILEGGYNPAGNASAVVAHLETLTAAQESDEGVPRVGTGNGAIF